MLWRLTAWGLQLWFRAAQAISDYRNPLNAFHYPAFGHKVTLNSLCFLWDCLSYLTVFEEGNWESKDTSENKIKGEKKDGDTRAKNASNT